MSPFPTQIFIQGPSFTLYFILYTLYSPFPTQIFEAALRPMVRYLFDSRGGHGTCFAYGQTGSGKTVTMEGLGRNGASSGNAAGLYSLVADEVFACVGEAARQGTNLAVRTLPNDPTS